MLELAADAKSRGGQGLATRRHVRPNGADIIVSVELILAEQAVRQGAVVLQLDPSRGAVLARYFGGIAGAAEAFAAESTVPDDFWPMAVNSTATLFHTF